MGIMKSVCMFVCVSVSLGPLSACYSYSSHYALRGVSARAELSVSLARVLISIDLTVWLEL